jgi:hypothetical protein
MTIYDILARMALEWLPSVLVIVGAVGVLVSAAKASQEPSGREDDT